MKLVTRITIFFFCVLWFIVATILIPPLPIGNLALILGLVVLFPIDKVKSKLYYYIHKWGIKKFYVKLLEIKYDTKK